MSLIEKILTEWAYRVHDGMPDIKNPVHIVKLKESMEKLNLSKEFISEFVQNLFEDSNDKYVHVCKGIYKKKGKEKDPNAQTFKKDTKGNFTPIEKKGDDGEDEKGDEKTGEKPTEQPPMTAERPYQRPSDMNRRERDENRFHRDRQHGESNGRQSDQSRSSTNRSRPSTGGRHQPSRDGRKLGGQPKGGRPGQRSGSNVTSSTQRRGSSGVGRKRNPGRSK